jgi:hypothetical protein
VDFSPVVRALVENGYVGAAVTLVVVWVVARLLRFLAQATPRLVRAANERAAVRRALKATTEAEGDRACRVLKILHGLEEDPAEALQPAGTDPPEQPPAAEPPGDDPKPGTKRRLRKSAD